ncbi:hypothetical protein BN903_111 [Halorubrum sp. AJ67]|nr:hypothetical protein BN903_111 [Halorubrum sp. AJ67]
MDLGVKIYLMYYYLLNLFSVLLEFYHQLVDISRFPAASRSPVLNDRCVLCTDRLRGKTISRCGFQQSRPNLYPSPADSSAHGRIPPRRARRDRLPAGGDRRRRAHRPQPPVRSDRSHARGAVSDRVGLRRRRDRAGPRRTSRRRRRQRRRRRHGRVPQRRPTE